jgi:hypothetical protein
MKMDIAAAEFLLLGMLQPCLGVIAACHSHKIKQHPLYMTKYYSSDPHKVKNHKINFSHKVTPTK